MASRGKVGLIWSIAETLRGDYDTENQPVTGPMAVGTDGEHVPVITALSAIIDQLNERFGTDFSETDRLVFDQIEEELAANQDLAGQARANSIDNFRFGFDDAFMNVVIDRRAQNEDIFTRLLDDQDFTEAVKAYMIKKVYDRYHASQ